VEPVDPDIPAAPPAGASELTREVWRRGVLEAQFVTVRERGEVNAQRLEACRAGLRSEPEHGD
jgi:hypothetical protein